MRLEKSTSHGSQCLENISGRITWSKSLARYHISALLSAAEPQRFATPQGFGERIVNELRSLPNVEYRGQVSPEQAMRVIADAAMFLSTSDAEGFPNTFTQAWSVGTPVVSLRLDPDNLIEEKGMGNVASSVDQAVTDIDFLMRSPQVREAMACRARQFIIENHSAERVIKLFENALI